MDRIYVTIDGEEREIFPNDYRPAKFVTEREQGWVFFRTKYNGTITITGEDFEDLYALGEDCSKQLIRIEREGLSDWHGYFTLVDGEMNLDDCTFSFTPRTDDPYDAFIEQGNEPYNIMQDTARTVSVGAPYSVNFTNCRNMQVVIQSMIDEIDSSYTLTSTFFGNANNPVTGNTNVYRYLFLAQSSDIKRPTASNKVRQADLSFLELMTIIRDTFNVWWAIDGSNLILEHYTYFREDVLLDLTADKGDVRAQRYIFDMSKMWKYERFNMMNGGLIENSIDFVNQGFVYEGKCLLEKDNELVRSVKISTDIEGILNPETTDNFSDDGFFMILGSSSVGGNIAIAQGYISENNKLNGDMSWANLLTQFWRDGRVLMEGSFWANPIQFWTAEPNKIQEVVVSICEDINPYGKYRTELAETLGVDGRLVRAEQATNGGKTRLTIAFGYEDVTPIPPTPIGKSITIVQSDEDVGTLKAYFSELSGIGLNLTVAWEVYQGAALIDSDSENWLVAPDNLLYDEFEPDFPAYDPSYCYDLTITPDDLSWSIVINQSPILKC